MSLADFPRDILLFIFSQNSIGVAQLGRLRRTCRLFSKLIRDADNIWIQLYVRKWGNVDRRLLNMRGWMLRYYRRLTDPSPHLDIRILGDGTHHVSCIHPKYDTHCVAHTFWKDVYSYGAPFDTLLEFMHVGKTKEGQTFGKNVAAPGKGAYRRILLLGAPGVGKRTLLSSVVPRKDISIPKTSNVVGVNAVHGKYIPILRVQIETSTEKINWDDFDAVILCFSLVDHQSLITISSYKIPKNIRTCLVATHLDFSKKGENTISFFDAEKLSQTLGSAFYAEFDCKGEVAGDLFVQVCDILFPDEKKPAPVAPPTVAVSEVPNDSPFSDIPVAQEPSLLKTISDFFTRPRSRSGSKSPQNRSRSNSGTQQ